MALFGENAAGKSTITDGAEWFFTDKVTHLWREDCKASALRNALLPTGEKSMVRLSFSNSQLESAKELSESFYSAHSNQTAEFKTYLAGTVQGGERIYLRNADLLRFIVSTKTEKRQELARIIGYDGLEHFKAILKLSQTHLQADQSYITAKADVQTHQKEIVQIAGHMVVTQDQLFQVGEQLLRLAGFADAVVEDQASYDSAVMVVRARIADQAQAQLSIKLTAARDNCKTLQTLLLAATTSLTNFIHTYDELLRSVEQVQQLKIEQFLSQSKRILDEWLTDVDICPLCLQPKNWQELKQAVSDRLRDVQESKFKHDLAVIAKGQTVSDLKRIVTIIDNILAATDLISPAFASSLTSLKPQLDELVQTIETRFPVFETIADSAVSSFNSEAFSHEITSLEERIEGLKTPLQDQKLIDLVRDLGNLRDWTAKYLQASTRKTKFERQIQTVELMRARFA